MCKEWLQGDLASWLALVLMGVAVYLGYRTLRPTSYIEFDLDWNIKVDDGGNVEVTGNISSVSPAAYITGDGSLKCKKGKVKLRFKRAEPNLFYANRQFVTFNGMDTDGIIESGSGELTLRVVLSDGTKKIFKGRPAKKT